MLLGTYQGMKRCGVDEFVKNTMYPIAQVLYANDPKPLPPIEEYALDWNESKGYSDWEKVLGFSPIWCIPCDTPKRAFIHSAMCAPNMPELFFLVNTEDYVRIDKVKWYDLVRKNYSDKPYTENDLRDCLAPDDLDDRYCEFVIAPETLREYELICSPFLTYRSCIDGKGVLTVLLKDRRMGQIPYETLCDIDDECEDNYSAHYDRIRESIDFIRENCRFDEPKYIYIWDSKVPFERTLLPFLVEMTLNDQKSSNLNLPFATMLAYDHLNILSNAFAMWTQGEDVCDTVAFDKFYDKFAECWCDDIEFIEAVMGNEIPGRNDPCVCGSGKKFKKCCAQKYAHLI